MSLSDRVQRLKSADLLGVLDDEALNLIAFNCVEQQMRKGSFVFLEGEEADGALFLIEGQLSLTRFENGAEIEEGQVRAGSLVDLYALISPLRRGQTAKAQTDVAFLVLDRTTFCRVLSEFPQSAERVKDIMEDKFTETVAELNHVAHRLDRLDKEFNNGQ